MRSLTFVLLAVLVAGASAQLAPLAGPAPPNYSPAQAVPIGAAGWPQTMPYGQMPYGQTNPIVANPIVQTPAGFSPAQPIVNPANPIGLGAAGFGQAPWTNQPFGVGAQQQVPFGMPQLSGVASPYSPVMPWQTMNPVIGQQQFGLGAGIPAWQQQAAIANLGALGAAGAWPNMQQPIGLGNAYGNIGNIGAAGLPLGAVGTPLMPASQFGSTIGATALNPTGQPFQQGFVQVQPVTGTSGAVLPQNFGFQQPGQLTQPILSAAQAGNIIPVASLQEQLNQRVANLPTVQGMNVQRVGA